MKKLGILIIALFSLTTNGLGQLEADYSDCLSELQGLLAEWEALETGENISEGTKEAIGAQVRDLVESLELGEAAEEHGVDDETIQNGAAQLLSSSFAMSLNALLRGGEMLDLAHRLEDAARRLFGKAETAVLLAEPLRLNWVRGFGTNLLVNSCSVDLEGDFIDWESSSPRFGRVNLTAAAAPPGGTFTWAWIRWTGNLLEVEVESSTMFETSEAGLNPMTGSLREANLNGELLPIQKSTEERSDLLMDRQIVKNVRLRGGVAPLEERTAIGWLVAVSYRSPEGARCWDEWGWKVSRSHTPGGDRTTQSTGRRSYDDALLQELERIGFPFGSSQVF